LDRGVPAGEQVVLLTNAIYTTVTTTTAMAATHANASTAATAIATAHAPALLFSIVDILFH
jgi:hypothetical protein